MAKIWGGVFMIGVICTATFAAVGGSTQISPSSVQIKVSKLAVSKKTNCQNPTIIFETTSGSLESFDTDPILGSGTLPTGSYPCIMIEISDTINFTPNTSSKGCTEGQSYTQDLCTTESYHLIEDRTTQTCTSGEDTIALFFSTASSAQNAGTSQGFLAPTSSDLGYALSSAIQISNDSSLSLSIATTEKILAETSSCTMAIPTVSIAIE